MSRKPARRKRIRIGRVSVYFHHGAWWLYYRENGRAIRLKVGPDQLPAEELAGQTHARLALGAPSPHVYQQIGVPDLILKFLQDHEHVRKSSVNTIRRYRSALQHLINFVEQNTKRFELHEFPVEAFVAYLRQVEITPNGHANTAKRRLRDKGLLFILEVCRSLLGYAIQQRHLPPYAVNPFARLPWERFTAEDKKPIYVFDEATEIAFWQAADRWSLLIHLILAKTGLRIGELSHLLIEDVDWNTGWLVVRNKPGLGWRVKSGQQRKVPVLSDVMVALQVARAARTAGPLLVRKKFVNGPGPPLTGTLHDLEQVCLHRQRQLGASLSRRQELDVARQVWRDAGAVKADSIRQSFIRIMRAIGHPEATCPKSWRHSFATLLQDANVDPLIRQITLGHRPSLQHGLGMTGAYTHTRPETQRQQIEAALRLWSNSLVIAQQRLQAFQDQQVTS